MTIVREHFESHNHERFVASDTESAGTRARTYRDQGHLDHRDRLRFSRNCHRKKLFIAVTEGRLLGALLGHFLDIGPSQPSSLPRAEENIMRAIDVMVRDVITVHADTDVAEAIKLLSEHDISALPVVDAQDHLIGIISEADLIHRVEIGTERHHPWWLEAVSGAATLAAEFAKSHGKRVGELMTTDVVFATEDTPISEIAALLERKRIKRVPITRHGNKLVGVVSRSNLIQALASAIDHDGGEESERRDREIRRDLLAQLKEQSWTDFGSRNVIVSDGVVHLWGLVSSEPERKALIALAEGVPGVRRVSDEMFST
jgi:CBS domain-containing protein